MPYEIDSNVTFNPGKRSGRKSKINEMPFDKIAIGESFHVAQTSKEAANRLSGYCQIAGKRLGKRFAMRTVADTDPRGPGVRIWRVEDKPMRLDSLFAAKGAAPAKPEPKAQKVVAKRAKAAAPVVAKPTKGKSTQPTPSRRQRRSVEGRSWQQGA
jgi:hypothetical protein